MYALDEVEAALQCAAASQLLCRRMFCDCIISYKQALHVAVMQFTQKKADAEVRWAVLNVAAILRRHEALHAKLADAMVRGESVAACIALIEEQLEDATDI